MEERRQRQRLLLAVWWAGLIGGFVWFLMAAAHVPGFSPIASPVYLLYSTAFAYIVVRTFLVLFIPRAQEYENLFLIVELLLITWGVAITGRIRSDFFLAYFVPITASGLMLSMKRTMGVAIATSVFHFLATLGSQSYEDYWELLATRTFFFLVVGALVTLMAKQQEAHRRRQALLEEELAIARERNYLARELHDSLGNTLTGSILQLQVCERLLDSEPKTARHALQEQIGVLRAAMDEMRALVFHLRPITQEPTEFLSALDRYLRQFSQRTGLQIEWRPPETLPDLSLVIQLTLLRLVQEALTNAAKHAQATRLEVHLSCDKNQLRLRICDDGRGFDPESAPTGIGLIGMRDRVTALRGSLQIISAPGQGTRVEAQIPLALEV